MWIHLIKGKPNQGVICLLPSFEERNAKIVMVEAGLMFFQFFRGMFVVSYLSMQSSGTRGQGGIYGGSVCCYFSPWAATVSL